MSVFTQKVIVLLLLVMAGIVIAGTYGAIHNQVSYSVSSEYFTRFKFEQFGLANSQLPERCGAAIVGVLASWWMGFPIGLLIGLAGFLQKGSRAMIRVSMKAFMVAVLVTSLFSICGLVYGFVQTADLQSAVYADWYLPSNLVQPRRFICAGYMHNSSYLGGVISVLAGLAYQIRAWLKQ
jgi:hypothetical protein